MYHVYIMASASGTLYAGVTNDLGRRVAEHRAGLNGKSFTSRYRCRKLLYAEPHPSVVTAIAREKEIKKWRREKKAALIASLNPGWVDLAEDIW